MDGIHIYNPIFESEYELKKILQRSPNHIFLAGQTLNFIEKNRSDIEPLIFDFLRQENKQMQIMICDPDFEASMTVWSEGCDIHTWPWFEEELRETITMFGEWLLRAQHEGINTNVMRRLDIRKTRFVQVSMTFIDPTETFGEVVLSPLVFQQNPMVRPIIVIEKQKHPDVYDGYWKQIWRFFNQGDKTVSL